MKVVGIIAILAAVAAAAPPSIRRRSNLSPTDTDLCNKASNCEIYDTPDGTRLRFKPGMEPGTAAYDALFGGETGSTNNTTLGRRDDSVRTQATLGRTTINYGTTVPADAFKQLTNGCLDSGSCVPDPIDIDTQDTKGKSKITLVPNGQYASPADRDNFVAAIVAAAGPGTKAEDAEQCVLNKRATQPTLRCKKITINKQTNFISVNRFSSTGNIQGFMTVSVTKEEDSLDWCSFIVGLLGAGLGPIADEIGGVAIGFFGTAASVACS